MPYGPNIITDPIDRLETSIGNWVAEPGLPLEGFIWAGGGGKLYQDLSWHINWGILKKDFFSPVTGGAGYLLTCQAFRPSYSAEADCTIGMKDIYGATNSVGVPLLPLDEWIDINTGFISPAGIDPDTAEIFLRLFSREFENQSFMVRNLSFEPEISVPGYTQYLPITGIG